MGRDERGSSKRRTPRKLGRYKEKKINGNTSDKIACEEMNSEKNPRGPEEETIDRAIGAVFK
jgi:hypothetical protein